MQKSANDNQIITGVSGTKGGMGYVGFSYAEEAEGIKILEVDSGDGCVAPEQGDDPGRLLQAALAPAVHVPEPDGAQEARDRRRSWTSRSENQQKIAEASKIVPITPEQAEKAKTDLTQAES